LPNTMAPTPSAASTCIADGLGTRGMTSNQRRTAMKKDPFTTSAESTALAAAGAPAWAGGSQRGSGKSAVFVRSPAVMRAAATKGRGLGRQWGEWRGDIERAKTAVHKGSARQI